MIWVGIGILVFILGTIFTRHVAGGCFSVVVFILWRIGALVTVFNFLWYITKEVFRFIRIAIQYVRYQEWEESAAVVMLFF
ncbi:hypothetical protein [Jeotgalibacillus haloalkalitolerans]|uniref:Uncharacterized protein n=1 Tax=Jeotgalibacillus haloalkalitolerans TaxID=3104292 RepID=A0ABU5KJM5_9BACL|nr:hypothetical protein [Jeotgalibacillus sp. HH7-29]MDZ5711385.1 hypothetical protein [Jeotgalibacillus sp. HH7-29]